MINASDVNSSLYGDDTSTDQKTVEAPEAESVGAEVASSDSSWDSNADSVSEETVSVADAGSGSITYQTDDDPSSTGSINGENASSDGHDSVALGSAGPVRVVTSDANNSFTAGVMLSPAQLGTATLPIVGTGGVTDPGTPALALPGGMVPQTIADGASIEVAGRAICCIFWHDRDIEA